MQKRVLKMQFIASEIHKQHHLNAWIGKYEQEQEHNIFIVLTDFDKVHGYNNVYITSKYF